LSTFGRSIEDLEPDVNGELEPLPYHEAIAARLEGLEPRAWALFADVTRTAPTTPTPPTSAVEGESADPVAVEDDLEQQLLRHAYRMEAAAHPRVHEAARTASTALGIEVPVVIYQLEGRDTANAALAFRPHEAVLALSGNLLALLTDAELVACFGHELAHYRLWTASGGRILAADRLLDALSLDAATPAAYLETARRFDLATELYADRGSLIASGDLDVAIGSLVKVVTGLSDVDPRAFLRQAESAHPERGTQRATHPETVLRAWALARWQAGEGDAAAAALLAPSLDIERLDVLDREGLESITRRLVLDVLAVDWMRTDAVVGHARQFLVEVAPSASGNRRERGWSANQTAAVAPPVEVRLAEDLPKETAQFLSYVLLDLATVDPDLEDEPIVEVAAVAREAGLAPTFGELARRELGLSARAWDVLWKRSQERRAGAPADAAAAPPDAEPPAASA
jgi:hypothetical protein